MNAVKKSIIIVGGGSGKRMQSTIPKQFMLLKGKPVIFWTIEKFYAFDSSIDIIVVLPQDYFSYWNDLIKNYRFPISVTLAQGGKTRYESVKNGTGKLSSNTEVVGIHDAVRPLVNMSTIANCFQTAYEKGNAIPVVPVVDSIRKISPDGNHAVDRKNYKIVQTPQCFRYEVLEEMYRQPYCSSFTDDASVLEKTGRKINLVEGNRTNIKITTPPDLQMAECFMSLPTNEND